MIFIIAIFSVDEAIIGANDLYATSIRYTWSNSSLQLGFWLEAPTSIIHVTQAEMETRNHKTH